MLHPNFLPTERTTRIARMWSRRLNHVRSGYNVSRCRTLARKLDWYRRSGDGVGLRMFMAEYDYAMAQAVASAHRLRESYQDIIRRAAA